MKDRRVLIVGAGPVGMVLASRLEHFGIKTKIIDKRAMSTEGSKGLSINAASLKIFDQMGIVDNFFKVGEKVEHINLHWHDKRLAHLDYKHLEGSPHKYYLALPQPDTESILSKHLSSYDREVDRFVTLKNIRQNKFNVDVDLISEKNGETTETFDYVVGCDGSRSTVRELMGFNFTGHDYNMYFMLFDAYLDWDGPRDETHYYVKEDGFVLIIPLTNGRHRVVIKDNLSGIDSEKKKRTIEEYQYYLDQLGPGGIRIKKLIWISSAPFYNRLSKKYRKDRVFLAGDAAHLFSPIGGLGMNTGIQDAYNLAWKLAGVIHGHYKENLLETYELERREMAKLLNAGIDKNTLMITRKDKNVDGSVKQWLPKMSNRKFFKKDWPLNFSGLGHRYKDDILSKPFLKESNLSGSHVPYLTGVNGCGELVSTYRLLDCYKPVLLLFSEHYSSSFLSAIKQLKQLQGKILLVTQSKQLINQVIDCDSLLVEPEFYEHLQAKSGDIILLRPDGYIGGIGNVGQLGDFCEYLLSFTQSQPLDMKRYFSYSLPFKEAV